MKIKNISGKRGAEPFHNIILAFTLFFSILMFGWIAPTYAATTSSLTRSEQKQAQALMAHFFSIKRLTGDFTQISSRGQREKGLFYMERPGKMRFDYTNGRLEIVADGTSIGVHNRALNNWSLYRLSQTPLKFLLDKKLNMGNASLVGFSKNPKETMLIFQDKSLRGGQLRLYFNNKSKMLEHWTSIDQQNLATEIYITHLRQDIVFSQDMFLIPYQDIAMKRREL